LEQEELITLSEAAEIAKMTPEHLAYLSRKGDLRARKLGRMWVTTRKAVLDYLRDEEKRSRNPYKKKR
jgi:hypothetical protein